jgi:hypothetical protein
MQNGLMTALTDAQLSAAINQLLTERSTPSYKLSETGDKDKKMFLSEIGQQTPARTG